MTRYLVTSRVAGFRRAGLEHPARKVYQAGELTETQLDAIRAEPNLTITEYTPESEAAPADGTLLSAGGGEDRLVVVMRAAGWGEAAPLVAVALQRLAENVLAAGGSATEFHGRASLELYLIGKDFGVFSATNILAPQQPAELAGRKAVPEAEAVESVDGEAARMTAHGDFTPPDGVTILTVPSSETGEATGSGSAAAAPVAVTTSDEAEAAPAKPAAKASRKSR